MSNPLEIERLLDVPVTCEAILPGPALRVGELLALAPGGLIKTTRPAGDTVDVFAAGSLIGLAELTDADGRSAVRMLSFPGNK